MSGVDDGAYSLAQLEAAFLRPTAYAHPPQGSSVVPISSHSLATGSRAKIFDTLQRQPDMCAAACAGLNDDWFQYLTTDQKNQCLREIFATPAIAELTHADYPAWRDAVWGGAEAESLGATDAYQITLAWSMQGVRDGKSRFDQRTFDLVWNSYRKDRACSAV